MAQDSIEWRVTAAVDAWLRWVPSWRPGTHHGRARPCRRCTGSPLVLAAGIPADTPHPVTHSLVARMHRIIDRVVDDYTAEELPRLREELRGADEWQGAPGYDPTAGLGPEFDGVPVDPEPEDGSQPFLFTLDGLAEESAPPPPLPRPPLTAEEKATLRREIEAADRRATEVGNETCFALAEHRPRIQHAIAVFIEPQIQDLLRELSEHLEPPS